MAVADPDPFGVPGRQLGDEWVGKPGERVIDRVADMAVIDAHAVGGRQQLDDLTGVECSIHGIERTVTRRPVLRDRLGHLSECATDRVDAGQVADRRCGISLGDRPLTVGALEVDDPALDEPGQGAVQGRQSLQWETILGVVGVQEVEGVFQTDVVGVSQAGRWMGRRLHGVTTLVLLTGYAQAGTVRE